MTEKRTLAPEISSLLRQLAQLPINLLVSRSQTCSSRVPRETLVSALDLAASLAWRTVIISENSCFLLVIGGSWLVRAEPNPSGEAESDDCPGVGFGRQRNAAI